MHTQHEHERILNTQSSSRLPAQHTNRALFVAWEIIRSTILCLRTNNMFLFYVWVSWRAVIAHGEVYIQYTFFVYGKRYVVLCPLFCLIFWGLMAPITENKRPCMCWLSAAYVEYFRRSIAVNASTFIDIAWYSRFYYIEITLPDLLFPIPFKPR